MFPIPDPVRILFFKAEQYALLNTPVTVQGHTRANGVFVAPYASRRKKRMTPFKTADLFGAGPAQHPLRAATHTLAPPGGSGGEPPDDVREAQRQYDAAVARYTNPDGTKKAGWLKAPNGQPTKLTERQWVQVRTENFKRWFGDWEVAAKEARITTLPLPGWDGNIRDLIALAREVYARQLQGKEILNLDTHEKIRFTAEGKGEAFSGIKKPVDAQIVESLIRLVRRAVRVDSEGPDARRMNDTKAFHTLVAPLQVGHEILVVKLTFREAAHGPEGVARWKFYDIAVFKEPLKQNARLGLGLDSVENSPPSTAPLNSGHKISVGRLLEEFKGDNLRHVPVASKVIDDNGEPLVVYHGTDADFSQFDISHFGKNDSGWYGKGFYFTPNKDWTFAEDSAERNGGAPNVMPVYLKVKNPVYGYANAEQGSNLVGSAAERGMDGVIVRYDPGHSQEYEIAEIVVTRPTQIKSAIGNRGTFDPKDAHLNKAWPFPPQVHILFFKSAGRPCP